MSIVISGTLALGWTVQLVDALKGCGVQAVGDVGTVDPVTHSFALLIHRAKALQSGISVVCHCMDDVLPKDPQIKQLLEDLAHLMLPHQRRSKVVINVPENDYFARCIVSGIPGTFHQLVRPVPDDYLMCTLTECEYVTPDFLPDTPGLLRAYVAAL